MNAREYDDEHNHWQAEELVQCAWCGDWVPEDEAGHNSDESTIPGTLGSGEIVCEGCRDGAS